LAAAIKAATEERDATLSKLRTELAGEMKQLQESLNAARCGADAQAAAAAETQERLER